MTEQFIKGHMITDITDVLSMKVPGEDKLVSEKIAGGFTDTSLTNPYGDGKAAERIVQAIKVYFNLADSVSEFHEGEIRCEKDKKVWYWIYF